MIPEPAVRTRRRGLIGLAATVALILATAVVAQASGLGYSAPGGSAPGGSAPDGSAPGLSGTAPTASRSLIPGPLPNPVAVDGLAGVTDLSAGWWNTCAVLAGGTVDCWGDTWMDVHGFGLDYEALARPTPIAGVSNAVQVAAGGRLICALSGDGTVKCWYLNVGGDFQDPNAPNRWVAVAIPGISGARSISAGYDGACAIAGDGSVKCWEDAPIPTDICAAASDGSLMCPVAGGSHHVSGVTAMALGNNDYYALLDDGRVVSWEAPGSLPHSPAQTGGLSDVIAIAAGETSSCAVVRSGSVLCWGDNGFGQLGDGTRNPSSRPVAVDGVHDAVSVSVGFESACASIRDGTVSCWGNAAYAGWYPNSPSPDSIDPHARTILGLTSVKAVRVRENHSCVLLTDGTVRCWGESFPPPAS